MFVFQQATKYHAKVGVGVYKNCFIGILYKGTIGRIIYSIYIDMAKEIGKVSHWYDKIGVAVVKLADTLKKGDTVKFKRGEEEFEETVDSLQINHADVPVGNKGDEVAMKLSQKAKEGAIVYKAE